MQISYEMVSKARFIRRISSVSNLIQLNAADMGQLIQTSNFCRILSIDTACVSVSGKMLQRLRNYLIWWTKILNGGFLNFVRICPVE